MRQRDADWRIGMSYNGKMRFSAQHRLLLVGLIALFKGLAARLVVVV